MNIDSRKEYLEIEKLLNSIEDISPKQKDTERTEKRRHWDIARRKKELNIEKRMYISIIQLFLVLFSTKLASS